MKIAYFFPTHRDDIRHYSGLTYFIAKNLAILKNEIYPIENCHRYVKGLLLPKKYYYQYLRKAYFDLDQTYLFQKNWASQIDRKIPRDSDFFFSPISTYAAYLQTKVPIAFWHDAPFGALQTSYYGHINYSQESLVKGNKIQEDAINNARVAVFTSDWAADFARKHYKIADSSKIHVVPYGANIVNPATENDVIAHIKERQRAKTVNFLFLGLEWERKQGKIALELVQLLQSNGIQAKLLIVGCNPVIDPALEPFVERFGRIDKSTEAGSALFRNVFLKSHFLIGLPKAEAFGLLYCEACSFGVPSIAANVGGIPTIIKDGINGLLVDVPFSLEKLASDVMDLLAHKERYFDLAMSSFNEYTTRLNWSTATARVQQLMLEYR